MDKSERNRRILLLREIAKHQAVYEFAEAEYEIAKAALLRALAERENDPADWWKNGTEKEK